MKLRLGAMIQEEFTDDQKYGKSLLSCYERKYIDLLVPKIPGWLKSYHLTLSNIIWSLLVILFSYFAQENINWMWLVSLMIVLQYLCDSFDGSIGRYRKEGLIKWGYYMDHFLDYVFLCAIFVGYLIIVDSTHKNHVFFLFAILTGFMINSLLYFPISNKYRNYYLGLGPTEGRLILIIINSLIAIFGKIFLQESLLFFSIFFLITLAFVTYKTQKEIWFQDISNKK